MSVRLSKRWMAGHRQLWRSDRQCVRSNTCSYLPASSPRPLRCTIMAWQAQAPRSPRLTCRGAARRSRTSYTCPQRPPKAHRGKQAWHVVPYTCAGSITLLRALPSGKPTQSKQRKLAQAKYASYIWSTPLRADIHWAQTARSRLNSSCVWPLRCHALRPNTQARREQGKPHSGVCPSHARISPSQLRTLHMGTSNRTRGCPNALIIYTMPSWQPHHASSDMRLMGYAPELNT